VILVIKKYQAVTIFNGYLELLWGDFFDRWKRELLSFLKPVPMTRLPWAANFTQ
jgi:hypothetical protein